MRSKAFTLIEVIVTLVIIAIIGLITIPIVFNIKEKAKIDSYKRSIDAYGKAYDIAFANYNLQHGDYPTSFSDVKVEYSGNEVTCETNIIRQTGDIYLSKCTVQGTLVKDKQSKDGYYHYGKNDYEFIDLYGKKLEEQIKNYLSSNDKDSIDLTKFNNLYSKDVVCNLKKVNDDNSLHLSQCKVDNVVVLDNQSYDGYYHYGDITNQDYIQKYGDSLSKSISFYINENNKVPTNLGDLQIDYKGKNVICNIKLINHEDHSLYLSNCSVAGKEVKDSSSEDGWYHYGEKKIRQNYVIGDEVTYNGMNFYVIANTDESTDFVTMLKAEPLTIDEVNKYGAGHVNRYTSSSVGTANNNSRYGGMQYYSSPTCGYVNGSWVDTNCTTDYAQSEVKYAVDAWAADKFKSADLKVDSTGYSARLIVKDELLNNLGCTSSSCASSQYKNWIYNSYYSYWVMGQRRNSASSVWYVDGNGNLSSDTVYYYYDVVRPVVTLLKSSL